MQCLGIEVVVEMSCADNLRWGAGCSSTCAWEQRSSLCQQWQPKFCIPRALLSSFSIPLPSPLSFQLAPAPCSLVSITSTPCVAVKQAPSLSLHHSSQSHQGIYPEGVKNILSCSCRPGRRHFHVNLLHT